MTSTAAQQPRSRAGGTIPPSNHRRSQLGMPLLAIAGLALLTIPRVIAHDLALVAPGSLANAALAFVPLLVWVAAAVLASQRPLRTLLAAGVGYGLALGLAHNLTWSTVWGDNPPMLSGNLAGAWPPATEELLMRGATGLSSLATGVVAGLLSGAIAWAIQELARRNGERLPLR